MISQVLKKVFGTQNDRELKKIYPLVDAISGKEAEIKKLGNQALKSKTAEFKEKLSAGASLDDILVEAFAVVREASVRSLGMRHFDAQLLGGIVLHQGRIAEMKTGEGKTLTATLPVYLNALAGKGVHVVTVNDYLAKRDAEWMGRVYGFLGLSTGCVLAGLDSRERQEAYGADISYGQNNEFGFDYLRDNMKLELSERAQRNHFFAIVDEVDSILIDEARTPLIISGPSEKPTQTYQVADQLVRKLKSEVDYSIELKSKQVLLTEEGVFSVEKLAGLNNLYDPQNIELVHHVQQALRAHVTMKKDVDYVVRDGQIIIVDEFTGRLMAGRRWSDGLHQAVEAKEGVTIQRENQTLATITFQNYFRMYDKLAGMTGTADTEAAEFKKIYNLDVVVVPTNVPMIRSDHQDYVFITEKAKFKAAVNDIRKAHERGQPVLVGTGSIEKSELLSGILDEVGVPHHVLNAKQHEREADIIAQAGRLGSVTISTNMAGRGTDILLGGNPDFLAASEAGTRDPEDEAYRGALQKYKSLCAEEKKKVLKLGGLHIVGTERHESRRIDNQLRGRAGRQGDPGSSQFFISFEDDLMKRFAGEQAKNIMLRVAGDGDEGLQGKIVSRSIERAQRRVEGHHFEIRKHLLDYDDVLNKQREVVYGLRERIIRGELGESDLDDLLSDVIENIILSRFDEKTPVVDWDLDGVLSEFEKTFNIKHFGVNLKTLKEQGNKELAQIIFDEMRDAARKRLGERKSRLGQERMGHFCRVIYLQAIDHFWKEHLSNMDHLREGINLRGYAQKNPLHEYQREGYAAFGIMMQTIQLSVIQAIFVSEIPSEEEIERIEEAEREALRKREEAAREIHLAEKAAAEKDAGSLVKGNREQRRSQMRKTMNPADYAPSKVASSGGGGANRKKGNKKKR
ncbi:MAG TPA: preprotein translocase subunit SecA [Oligoflexia bacterium]|nr:preprotein translocase subunit SecA [Oligoflexia bacterium]HMP48315.1 preprotein translocase subunit SecA [Oligoflexia bacterium]